MPPGKRRGSHPSGLRLSVREGGVRGSLRRSGPDLRRPARIGHPRHGIEIGREGADGAGGRAGRAGLSRQGPGPRRVCPRGQRLGYPVLLKAVAGGGGKGMRVVRDADELEAAIAGAKREASAAFGDDNLLLEKFVERPRHIEVQVFGDAHGQIVSLFERDCTLQRRHQKVIEEAPSAALNDERREALYEAARRAAAAIGYVGAGTVEFVADAREAYFIEMNTRLQVEHPVTEMITGLDLVEWQLRIAMGERLPFRQDAIARRGHAIEARIYAEDASAGFLPSTGEISHWRAPQVGAGLRIDTGFGAGDIVSQHYDPMIAKVIAHADTRESALTKLTSALASFEIAGVTTNIPFLVRLLAEEAVIANEVDTGFIEREGAGRGGLGIPHPFTRRRHRSHPSP